MQKKYLEWLDDDVLIAAVQYLASRVQSEMNYSVELNPVIQLAQQELLPTIDYRQAIALNRLERSMPMFHRLILSSLTTVEVGDLDGTSYDLMTKDKQVFVELQTYFRYKIGTAYIDRLGKHAQQYPDKRFYLCFVNGSYDNDILPAKDRIELSYPDMANLFIQDLESIYSDFTTYETALQELIEVLPVVFRQVVSIDNPHVFVSYSRTNTSVMKRIVSSLAQYDISAWTDESLQPGTPDWQMAIVEALENAACVLLILSPASKQSKWVRNELNYALEKGQPIIPFWIHGESSEVSMLNLITAQRVDARLAEDYDNAIQETAQSIENYVHQRLLGK